jgi:hypothetical protein
MCIDAGERKAGALDPYGQSEPVECGTAPSSPFIFTAREIRLWAGCSEGARCDMCQQAITPSEMEYEVEAELSGHLVRFRFHLSCYRCWRIQSRSR